MITRCNAAAFAALAALLAGSLASPDRAAAQTVTVQGQVQVQTGNPPQGYGQPPPGYGQPQPQPYPQGTYAPTYQAPTYLAPPQRQVRYEDRETNIKALWIPGVITFGVSWVLSGSFGSLSNSDYATWMWIPLVGPWASLGYAATEDETIGSVIGGITQAAGLTMFVLGLTLTRTVRVAVYALDEDDARSPTLALDAAPLPGGGRVDLTLSHF